MRLKFDPVFEIGDDGMPERRDVEEKIITATKYAVPFIFACYISITIFAAAITGSVEMNFSYFTYFSSIPAANVLSWTTKVSMGIAVLLFLLTKTWFKGGKKNIARSTMAILRDVTFFGYMAATVIVDIMLVTGDPASNWIARFTDGVHTIVIPAWVDLIICGLVAIISTIQLVATISLSRVRIGLERAFSDPEMGGKVVVSGATRFECADTPLGKMCRIASDGLS